MTTDVVYTELVQPKGRPYRESQIVPHSHYRDPIDRTPGRLAGNSRVWGDASPQVQSRVIDRLIEASRDAGLSPRQTAHVLAIARVESGFNPDAAAGTTSAFGLGQFIDRTAASYGVGDANRGDVRVQSRALVAHYLDNLRLARSRGQGDEYVYKYHHDGPTRDYGGLELSRREVMSHLDQYERLVRQRLAAERQTGPGQGGEPQAAPGREGAHGPAGRETSPLADGILRHGERGAAVASLQRQLNAHGIRDAQGHPLPLTGNYLDRTRAAVEAFQRSVGLDATGVADPATRAALARPAEIRYGQQGAAVMHVQQMLRAAGMEVPVTGRFNYQTEGAVKDFQLAQGLMPTGVVSGETLYRLRRGEARHVAAAAPADPPAASPPVAAPADPPAASRGGALLTDPAHPDHALFSQALRGMHALDAAHRRPADIRSTNAAGALAVSAREAGLERIDHVVLGEGGSRLFAVQGALDSPLRRVAWADTVQAVSQPVEASTQRIDAAASARAGAPQPVASSPEQQVAARAL
ncbi:MAG: XVIPCD domain-containing protein [Pseudomonadota bacterium]